MNKEKKIKIWVLNYALSTGVYVRNGYVEKDGMAVVDWKGGMNGVMYVHGQDFQLSEEAARKQVAKMVASKLQSLEKQMKKLNDLKRLLDAGKLPMGD